MPTLDFKGKSFIYTHHLGVPYRELLVVPEKSCPAEGRAPDLNDNLILHGDNLEALKALLPRYAGKVDCIYIDPPYNTGNEGWCYSDAVNAPLMREWLKKSANPVERDDLQRHDKWLCMMWPRLQLLKELLAEDGMIFVSIDDNEEHRLRAIMDEIFGDENFLANISWVKRYTRSNNARMFYSQKDATICYRKSDMLTIIKEPRTEKSDSGYGNPDKDSRGMWMTSSYVNPATKEQRKGLVYKITRPKDGKKIEHPTHAWKYSPQEHARHVEEKLLWWGADGMAEYPRLKLFLEQADLLVPLDVWSYREVGSSDDGSETVKQIFGGAVFDNPKPTGLMEKIIGLTNKKDALVLDSFAGSGTTAHAVLALNAKDGGTRRFILCEMENYADTLTAERVRRVIRGYDYTGTAETELMKPVKVTWTTFGKDNARNEILDRIEGIENLERTNYEKIEKKIEDGVLTVVGKRTIQEKMPGLGGGFTYVELGEPMDLERLLAETPSTLPSFPALARYLFFTATGHTLPSADAPATPKPAAKRKGKGKAKAAPEPMPPEGPILIGETAVWRIYLHYRPDETWLRSPAAAFTRTQAEAIAAARDTEASGKQVLVFAAAKYIAHRSLRELRVDFAQLPYALHRVQAE